MKNKIMQWFVRLVRFDMGYFMGKIKNSNGVKQISVPRTDTMPGLIN